MLLDLSDAGFRKPAPQMKREKDCLVRLRGASPVHGIRNVTIGFGLPQEIIRHRMYRSWWQCRLDRYGVP